MHSLQSWNVRPLIFYGVGENIADIRYYPGGLYRQANQISHAFLQALYIGRIKFHLLEKIFP